MTPAKKKILIVEDEPSLQYALKARLEATGFEVLGAMDGPQGLALAQSVKPDLVILDLMLPKLDGYAICKTLKSDSDSRHTRILILSARTRPIDIDCGRRAGADAYLTKPFDSGELMATIRRLLDLD